MKVIVNLNDIVEVKLTFLGASIYNARAVKNMNAEERKVFYDSSDYKKEGDTLRGNLHSILRIFSTEQGYIDKECFENEEFEVQTY